MFYKQHLRCYSFVNKLQSQTVSKEKIEKTLKMLVKLTPGADAINISGLLNTKKLGNFKNQML